MSKQERSYAKITTNNLEELRKGSIKRLKEYFINGDGKKWSSLYNIACPFCIALCQGAAMHYCDKSNGIKDFDVWFFYPFNKKHLPYRTIWNWDYQNAKFGSHPKMKNYKGRKVDVIVRSLKLNTSNNPTTGLLTYLSNKQTKSATELSKKAVVLIRPRKNLGNIIWYREKING
jgi:hypothetical protein